MNKFKLLVSCITYLTAMMSMNALAAATTFNFISCKIQQPNGNGGQVVCDTSPVYLYGSTTNGYLTKEVSKSTTKLLVINHQIQPPKLPDVTVSGTATKSLITIIQAFSQNHITISTKYEPS